VSSIHDAMPSTSCSDLLPRCARTWPASYRVAGDGMVKVPTAERTTRGARIPAMIEAP
jgi:hypothetical protein